MGLVTGNKGNSHNSDLIVDGVDYISFDLQLPPDLKPYESVIRDTLASTIKLDFIHLDEGNHELNSDWDRKGYNLTKLLEQQLQNYKKITGADTEIAYSEFIVNKRGDILQAPLGCISINGYNVAYSHLIRSANGATPTKGMAEYYGRLGDLYNEVHIGIISHLHFLQSSVIDGKFYIVTGGGAGQSGFEQGLGLSSKPLFVIQRFFPDGRFAYDTLGVEFLKKYEIQNPIVRKMGLENFIKACLTEEVSINTFDGTPEYVQPVHQRQLVLGKPNKRIGPKID